MIERSQVFDCVDVQHKIKKKHFPVLIFHILIHELKEFFTMVSKRCFMHVFFAGYRAFGSFWNAAIAFFYLMFHFTQKKNIQESKQINETNSCFFIHFITQNTQEIFLRLFIPIIASPNHQGIYFPFSSLLWCVNL